MIRMLHAELRKLLGTQLWLWLLLATAGVTAGSVAVIAVFGPVSDPPLPPVDTEAGVRAALSVGGLVVIIPALLGAAAMTQEYRHRTITGSFLFVPRRYPVVLAKVATYAAVGVVFGVAAAVAAWAGLVAVALPAGLTVGADPGTIAGLQLRLVAATAVYTILGVGVGALIRNQLATLLVVGGYLYTLEPMLILIPGVNHLYPYLPGGATASLTEFSILNEAMAEEFGNLPTLLPPAGGWLVMLGYGLAAAAIAIALPVRRDVT